MRGSFGAILLLLGGLPAGGAGAASGLPYPVVDTGQTVCYGAGREALLSSCPGPGDAYYGQDANYPGTAPAYRDNGDGTVSDLITGLMWQKGSLANVAWGDAPGAAAKATTGGHADWRVPTIKELYSLMNFQGTTGHARGFFEAPSDAKPFIDTRFFDFEYPTSGSTGRSQPRYIDAQYISSAAYTGRTMHGNPTFFGVNFADGRIKGYPQRGRADGAGWYLRLVRGNPQYGRNDFADNGDGTVTDRATGLVWMRVDSGDPTLRGALGRTRYRDGRMDWPEALRFCEGLSFVGKADWRLPDAKELQSLLDYTRSPQATRSAAIDPLFAATAITDEAGKLDFAGYWTSTTHLDGRNPGTNAAVVFFGEALGMLGGGQGGGPMGMGMNGPQGPMGGGGFRGGPPPGGMGGPPGGMMGPGFPGPAGMEPREPGGFRGGPPQGGMMMGGEGGRGTKLSGANPAVIDVHGAGAQRSDPKIGDADDYPQGGLGPQGDVRRVYNYVRCVRWAR